MGEHELSREQERWAGKVAVEPLLAESDLLMQVRTPEGEFPAEALDDIFENIITDAYETVVPNGVAKIVHIAKDGDFPWMGMGSVENAQNGHIFCSHDFAHQRVDVEVDEAADTLDNLRPGWAKITISPRAAGTIDATDKEAEDEQLHDRDLVRIQYLTTNQAGEVETKVTESIQVFDVPLSAWVSLVETPGALVEESVPVEPPNSALALLKTHRQLYVPLEQLPQGPVSVLEAVKPHITDPEALVSVERQLEKFEADQEDLRQKVEQASLERVKFLSELTNSRKEEKATEYIASYIDVHKEQFKGQQKVLVDFMRKADGTYKMNDQFAKICSGVNKTIVAARAGVAAENEEVFNKLNDPDLVERIHRENVFFANNNISWEQQLHMRQGSNQGIAASNLRPRGGCAADMGDIFGSEDSTKQLEKDAKDAFGPADDEEEPYGFDEKMYCVVCQAPPKADEAKKMCGPCGICEGCDKKIRAKSAAA